MKNKVNLSITRCLCPSVFICFLTALLNVSTIAYATELQSAPPSNTIQTVYSQLLSAQKLCYQRVKWTDKKGIQQETSKFEQAVYEGELQVVQNMLHQDCAFEHSSQYFVLNYAIEGGHLEMVKLLIEQGFDPHQLDYDYWTSLIHAAASGQLQIIDYLLSLGVSRTAQTGDGKTILMIATEHNQLAAIKHLLQKGFDPNEQDSDDETALTTAIQNQNKEIIKLLLDFGARLDLKTRYGEFPLHTAISPLMQVKLERPSSQPEIVKLLLDAGANPNQKSSLDYTPLMDVARDGNLEIFKLLLEHGAKLEITESRYPSSPSLLTLAILSGNIDMIKFLQQKGFDLHQRVRFDSESQSNELEFSLLPLAAISSLDVVKYLLDQGVKFQPYPEGLILSLYFALNTSQVESVNFLFETYPDPLLEPEFIEGLSALDSQSMTFSGTYNLIYTLAKHGAKFNIKNNKDGDGRSLLMVAAKSGDTDLVSKLLELGSPLDEQALRGYTALMYAVEAKNIEIAKTLIEAGAKVDSEPETYNTALKLAIQNQHIDMITLLLDHGANPYQNKNNSPLTLALESGNAETVELLLKRFPKLKSELSADKATQFLPMTAEKGSDQLVELLLDYGADIHSSAQQTFTYYPNDTALNLATREQHISTVKMLLDHGAHLQAYASLVTAAAKGNLELIQLLLQRGTSPKQSDLGSALLAAAEENHLEAVKLLLDHGAPVDTASDNGETALMFAAEHGNLEMMDLLLRQGAQVNQLSMQQESPLMFAAKGQKPETLKYLLAWGADVKQISETGKTVLMYAIQGGHLKMVELLLKLGLDPYAETHDQQSCLQIAVENGSVSVAKVLLSLGLDPNHQDLYGHTALMRAVENNDFTLTQLLIEHGAKPELKNKDGLTAFDYYDPSFGSEFKTYLERLQQASDQETRIDAIKE